MQAGLLAFGPECVASDRGRHTEHRHADQEGVIMRIVQNIFFCMSTLIILVRPFYIYIFYIHLIYRISRWHPFLIYIIYIISHPFRISTFCRWTGHVASMQLSEVELRRDVFGFVFLVNFSDETPFRRFRAFSASGLVAIVAPAY